MQAKTVQEFSVADGAAYYSCRLYRNGQFSEISYNLATYMYIAYLNFAKFLPENFHSFKISSQNFPWNGLTLKKIHLLE